MGNDLVAEVMQDRLRRAPTPELQFCVNVAHDALYRIRERLSERECQFVLDAMTAPAVVTAAAEPRDLILVRDACWILAARYDVAVPVHSTAQRVVETLSLRRRVAALRMIYG